MPRYDMAACFPGAAVRGEVALLAPAASGLAELDAESLVRLRRLKDDTIRAERAAALLHRRAWLKVEFVQAVTISHDASGAPILQSIDGTHVSFSTSGAWSAIAASPHPIGIDVERLREIEWHPMLDIVATDAERDLIAGFGAQSIDAFFRLWTAKEAILKAARIGLKGGARRIDLPPSLLRGDVDAAAVMYREQRFDVLACVIGEVHIAVALNRPQ